MQENKDQFLPLSPITHPWVEKFMEGKIALRELMDREASPVNMHSLDPFVENIQAYKEVFERYKLKYKIFFARKANKSIAFARKSFMEQQGVDTASYRELKQSLDAGIAAESLILTAAIKNEKLIELAVGAGVMIVIDNEDELTMLQKIAEHQAVSAPISIRLGGFKLERETLHSRFGFSPEKAFGLIKDLSNEGYLDYKGLHFHLNGYSTEQRALAIEQCIELIDRLEKEGIKTGTLDIGGGFLINYLKEKTEWENFHKALKDAVLGQREPITYGNDPLGMVHIEGKLYGEPTVYPYYNELNKQNFLDAILQYQSTVYGKPLYRLIEERQLTLHIEPGRSLLDQAGVTLAKVAFRKQDSQGNLLVGLEMNRSQLKSSSADFLLDPVHIAFGSEEKQSGACEGYLVGSYCLEQELILKRKIKFDRYPAIGDIILFPNTAGYMMHFFESEAHLFELAKNLFI